MCENKLGEQLFYVQYKFSIEERTMEREFEVELKRSDLKMCTKNVHMDSINLILDKETGEKSRIFVTRRKLKMEIEMEDDYYDEE